MTELESLEQKLVQLVAMHAQSRAEGRELRNRITQLEAENRKLVEKVTSARTKVEAMIERLPAGEEV